MWNLKENHTNKLIYKPETDSHKTMYSIVVYIAQGMLLNTL